jgi:hypothetical protein
MNDEKNESSKLNWDYNSGKIERRFRTSGNRYQYHAPIAGRDTSLSKKEVEQILNKPSF